MKRFKSIVLAALALAIAGAYALPPQQVAAQGSAALSIVPKKNYTIEPGKSIDDKLMIRNIDGEKELNLTLRVVDFTFTDEGGTPKLMLAEDAPQTTWSLRSFLKVPQTVKIPPKGSKTVDMSVAIPKNQGAGSYYSAIVYSSGAPDGGNVGLSASGVTLVFTQIPGKVTEDLKLKQFGAYDVSRKSYVFFAVNEPHNIAYTLKNNGNVTASPTGTITLKNIFGKEYEITDVNPSGSLALIGQERTYTACIKTKAQDVDFNGTRTESKACVDPELWPGYYSVDLNLFYGQNGNNTQEINSKASFWYLPWWFLLAVAVVLLLIAYIVWRIVSAVKGRQNGRVKLRKRK